MKPSSFDEVARALAVGVSRRRVVIGVGAAALSGVAGVAGLSLNQRSVPASGILAQPEPTPTPDTVLRPTFDPLLPTLDPLPIGNDVYQLDGATFVLDPEVAAILQDDPIVPITIDNDTVFINSSIAVTPSDELMGSPEALATPAPTSSESDCGTNDSQDVEAYLGDLGVTIEFVVTHESAVGNLRWNTDLISRYRNPGTVNARRWCTGTLITDNLLLTAGHCFEQNPRDGKVPNIDGTEFPIPRAEIATNMHVDFHYQLDPMFNKQDFESFPVIELVEDRFGGLDYAIIRLQGTPGLTYGVARIAASDPPAGKTICIIGHPSGLPKRIEAGPASQLQNDFVYYDDIDTAPGSSGSGILYSPDDSPDGPLVGVHTNGGCDVERTRNNHGIRISALLRVSPILQALAGGNLEAA